MKLSKTQTIIGTLLLLAIVFGYLLTPLGFEPRNPDLRTYVIVPFFIAASLGIPLTASVFLFIKPKVTSILVIINAIIMLFLVAGDQAGFFFTTPPPVAITVLEFLSIAVSIGFLLYGPVLFRETKVTRTKK
jgi:asparagine N-glycosylation enzyme membrane subunit Stt3